MHAAVAAAKSDILFRPRAKVMREREGERGEGNEERRRPKIGVFCRDDLCVSFCERRGGWKRRKEASENLAFICCKLPPFLRKQYMIFTLKSGSKSLTLRRPRK